MQRYPLKATISQVTVAFGLPEPSSQDVPEPILNYDGTPLNCFFNLVDDSLEITITDAPDADGDTTLPVDGHVSTAIVTVAYGTPSTTVAFTGIDYTLSPKSDITYKMHLTSGLDTAILSLYATPSAKDTDRKLGFVLVQELAPPNYFRVEWVSEMPIVDLSEITQSASIVMPPPVPKPGQGGSVMGPMGLSMP